MEHEIGAEPAGGKGRRTVAIALSGESKSKDIVRWAVEKFIPEKNIAFKLLHVFRKITGVPTPMGNLIPLPQVRDDVAIAYKREIEWQKTEMITQYQKLFIQKKVPAEVVIIESDEIASAIALEIARYGIKDLVIGASSNGLFSRRSKGQLLSSVISDCAPRFCCVYVVSKGKLESLRPSNVEADVTIVECDSSACDSNNSSSRYTSSTFDPGSVTSESPFSSPIMPRKDIDSLSMAKNGYINHGRETALLGNFGYIDTRYIDDALSLSLRRTTSVNTTVTESEPWVSSFQPFLTRTYSVPVEAFTEESPSTSSAGKVNADLELETLRMELQQIQPMYATAQNETMYATQRLIALDKLRNEEALKLRGIREEEDIAKELARQEKDKLEAAKKENDHTKRCVKGEEFRMQEAKLNAVNEAKMYDNVLAGPVYRYQKWPFDTERLKDVAEACGMDFGIQETPPNHFICPILKDVMEDPYVASDGYTYDRKAIEKWLKDNDTSPTTNFPLSNKNLLPNYTLLYAIMDWKSRKRRQQHGSSRFK